MDITKIEKICDFLDKTYGSPRLGNKDNPLDELVYILLSTKTQESSYVKVYNDLKRKFKKWDDLLKTDERKIEKIIEPAGLARLKTKRLLGLFKEIKEKNCGDLSLNFLRELNDSDAEKFLLSLNGVGYKMAKSILLYSLKRNVLPVDTHTYALALELGLISKTYMRNEKGKLHKTLEEIIPPDCRFRFHVNAIVHGRVHHRKKIPDYKKCELVQQLEERHLLPL